MNDDTLTRDKLPQPRGTVVPYPNVTTWDQATDYICASYHACLDKMEKTDGAEQRLWRSAALSYFGAFMGVAGLKVLPGDAGLAKTKEQIAEANQKMDDAAPAKLTHDKLPRPVGKVVPFPKVDTWEEAIDYIVASYHACVDKIGKTEGAEERLWYAAALAYFGAYMGTAGLKVLPNNVGLAKTKEQIAEANHKADIAANNGKKA